MSTPSGSNTAPLAPSDGLAPRLALLPDEVRTVIIGLMLAILLAALDQTIVSVALPRMAEDLKGFSLLAWVVSGYLVASTVVTPIYGRLGDLFGRRLMLSGAILIFLVSSCACALASSMPMLVAARVLQGLGGGGLISTSQAIIADVVSLRERGRYQGYISGVYAVSSVAGPVVGGLLTHYLSWRWCFWINLPLGLAAFLASRKALARLPVPGVRRRIDYFGAVLLCTGLSTLLLFITRIGQGIGALENRNVELIVAAMVGLSVFVLWEKRQREPIVPLELFRIRAVTIGCAVLFFGFFNLIGMSVLLPLRFQIVAAATADQAALRLVPLSLFIPLGAFVAGRTMTYSGRYRPIALTGAILVPLAMVAVALCTPTQTLLLAVMMSVAGLGIGLQFPTSLVAVQNAVPQSSVGIATASTALFRSLGGAIGIAVLSTVLLATLHGADGLPQGTTGGDVLHAILVAASAPAALGTLDLRVIAEHAFTRIFLVGAVIAMIPIALIFYLPDATLHGRDS